MFKKELKDNRLKLIITFFVFLTMFLFLYFMQQKTYEIFNSNTSLREMFNSNQDYESYKENLKDYSIYIKTQWYIKNIGQFIPFLGILLSFSIFTKEFTKKTISIFLLRIGRKNFFNYKFFSNLIFSIILILFIDLFPFFGILQNKILHSSIFFEYFLGHVTAFLIFYSFTIFISLLTNEQSKTLIISFFVLVFFTSVSIFGIKELSIYYFISNPFFSIWYTILLLFLSIIFYLISLRLFLKKEL
ncbi:hypothetical protein OSSY52_16100 [Tepiditoga spiralis]|uniref:Uncharacterized protein n=1 Tax=Tepiditoga spiralis TaxID=2108365 RepID=A0A7G1GBX9_9BACT|nr:ABC transporter permease subunit [Tepiditoga spiralis]BBE31469.1 hypothetical protein OSSY52_16100 [Tepiditoga spiralis]